MSFICRKAAKMNPRYLVSVCAIFISTVLFAQLEVNIKAEAGSDQIKDGTITVEVLDGQAPYHYKWSNKGTAQDSPISTGNDEGTSVHVTITDTGGKVQELDIPVPAVSGSEKINSFFIPAVDGINSIVLYDPFAALGFYDNRLSDGAGNFIFHPNGDHKTQSVFLVVVWLMFGAVFFTLYMKFVNFRGFMHALSLVRGRYDDPKDRGEVTHFQALATALSGTIGLGNIAGVATAIALGGPGATFWMIVAGFLGMSSKFVECTLGVKYRRISKDGEVSGGPMYYLSDGLKKRGLGKLGRVLAIIFAVLCIGGALGGGNMYQSNQAFSQFKTVWLSVNPDGNPSGFIFGLVCALLVGIVIIGGIKKIANVTDKLVPFMCALYIIFALIIIGMNFDRIGEAFASIINGAFNADAAKGGFIGVLIWGFRRASFSNEAGVGSASIAHSASKTERPVSEGLVSILEPFIDTVVICTFTALVIVFTGYGADPKGLDGAALTNAAFTTHFPWFQWILMMAIFCFAYSTMISWSYYGLKAWGYLFGESRRNHLIFQSLFVCFTVVGSSVGLASVMDFSDSMILGMAFPNIIGLLILAPEVRKDLKEYMSDLKSGVIKRYK
jgi:AGCS family alanine or glycine:cation symporter